jgi:ribulose bisphosphate carboxylase small subunit
MMALADEHADMSEFRNGIWARSGRIAYRKQKVNMS